MGSGIESQAMNPIDMSPEQFRRLSERIIAIATDYLKGMDTRGIPPEGRGSELENIYRTPLPETGLGEEACSGLADIDPHLRRQNGSFFLLGLWSGGPGWAA